jgi:GNAT superfamily N-acetyltransferase
VRAAQELAVRPYHDADEPSVLALLRAALGGGPAGIRSAAFFRWKHLENPFGRSFLIVAEADGRIVGLRAFLRWRFQTADRIVEAVRAVDTATHPDYQGRGVFSRLTRRALEELRGEADLVFNTPNAASLAGYLKMGWSVVGHIPVRLRIRRPVSFARHVRGHGSLRPAPTVDAAPASVALRDRAAVADLLERSERPSERLFTPRTTEYLQWRYGREDVMPYRVITEEREGQFRGLAIFRVRSRGALWESMLTELIVPAGDSRTAGQLLRRVVRAAATDHLTSSFHSGSMVGRTAMRAGFVRLPRGVTLAANRLRDDLRPDPTDLRSWALTLGDVEVF